MTLQDDEIAAMRASLDRIEGMLAGDRWTYEDVDRIRSRDLRIIGDLTMSERNLVEQLGLATVRAEQLEDANAAIIAAHDALCKQFARAEAFIRFAGQWDDYAKRAHPETAQPQ